MYIYREYINVFLNTVHVTYSIYSFLNKIYLMVESTVYK